MSSFFNKINLHNVYVRRDTFGRVFFDTCATDHEHLNRKAENGIRPGCRVYLDDIVRDDRLSRKCSVNVKILLDDSREEE